MFSYRLQLRLVVTRCGCDKKGMSNYSVIACFVIGVIQITIEQFLHRKYHSRNNVSDGKKY